ncbi:MAG: hypothetical protein M0006_11035 [Magnetospirillum sp.]|nr:hypothetical protein [Magnetospirillum sp.]
MASGDGTVDGIPPEERPGYEEYRAKVEGTNISTQTLLATDYLNHFNEIVMLIDMLPDMPELVGECKGWLPKSYTEHFAQSSFSDRQLAIESYSRVPARYRRPFEETIAQLNTLITGGIARLDGDIAAGGDPELLRQTCIGISRAAQALMDCASAIIHGSDRAMAQIEIDSLLRG